MVISSHDPYEVGAGDLATLGTTIVATLGVCVGATILATKRLREVDLASELRET